ncbi:MAG: hypothetical protein Pyrs2KO_30490 [Pyruvatibacter sp.]
MVVHQKPHTHRAEELLAWPYSCSDIRIWTGHRYIWLDIPRYDELSELADMQEREIGNTASAEVCEAVFSHNPDSFRVFRSGDSEDYGSQVQGFSSSLFLNDKGLAALEAGTFDGRNPKLSHLAPPLVRPAATYAWALVARGFGTSAVTHTALSYRQDIYKGVPVWCTAGSKAGAQLINSEGLENVHHGNGVGGVFKSNSPLTSMVRS